MSLSTPAEYIQGAGFTVQVVRTNRRQSATVRVDHGQVSVIVPKRLASARIRHILETKHQWIQQKIALHQTLVPPQGKTYISGEAFAYLGRNYRLKVLCGPFEPVKLVQGRLLTTLPQGKQNPERVRTALICWYQHRAQIKLREKTQRYAKLMGVEPHCMRIKTFKARWGSCSHQGMIDFNWKLIMAPNRVVDYVVVHELCHLIHFDHSPNFWRAVQHVMPDYRDGKEWLKRHGEELEV